MSDPRPAPTRDGISSLPRFTKGTSRPRLSCAGIEQDLSPGTELATLEENANLRPFTKGNPS